MTEPTIRAYSWNPRRGLPGPGLWRLRWGPRTRNFGDLLGPDIVERMRARSGLSERSRDGKPHTLFTVGSVLHFAQDDDVIWGTGVNGKMEPAAHAWTRLDIRAVRGPLTRRWLREQRGLEVPEIYGDPALLLFELGYPRPERSSRHNVSFLPNLNDRATPLPREQQISPRRPLNEVVARIAASDHLVTSSLHGLVLAELIGVPVALLRPAAETMFKYEDYVRGTGRTDVAVFDDFDVALRHATRPGADRDEPLAEWSPRPLMDAFPVDIFTPAAP
ncbi:polysaccharide pyruvyl transferase family protein [Microbacterium sp.]|uniref:polysaccharide pyruvyl transferase family protein n=1 Tax=Microbacterium sp. TaxID=51671 RepID=UPI0039E4B250